MTPERIDRQQPASPFLAGVWAGVAPLLLWAAHFAFCYLAVAVGCVDVLGNSPFLSALQLRLLLVAGSVLALASGLWLLRHAWGAAHAQPASLLAKVRLVGAGLALVAMAWGSVPLALLPLCQPG